MQNQIAAMSTEPAARPSHASIAELIRNTFGPEPQFTVTKQGGRKPRAKAEFVSIGRSQKNFVEIQCDDHTLLIPLKNLSGVIERLTQVLVQWQKNG